jgi:tetratricopeptide (TPR) repeat protein
MSDRIVDNSTLLVVQVEPPQQEDGGDYYYRTYAPGLAMAREEGVYVINLTNVHRAKEDIMRKADVLILKNICDADILPLIKERKQQKRLTVYELADDICAVPPWNPTHFFYKDQENLLLFKRLAGYCDTMQFSVPELQRLYSYLTPCSAVFLNQITDVPSERNFEHSKDIIIGWGGSHGHLEDMAQVAEPLIDWIISRDKVKLFLMCSDPIWSLFERLPKMRKQRFKTGSLSDYYAFLKQIDIGLAPLKNTGFNRSRSDVKFLEYAVFDVVPVVQAAVPYVSTVKYGETGFLFEDTAGMLNILDMLADDIACIPKVARAAREYVINERLQRAHSQERTAFYRTQLRMLNNGNGEKAGAGSIFEAFADIEGAMRDGRYLKLTSTRFENLLHDGLVLSQVEEEKVSAWSAFSEAFRAEPDNYLPYLFGASCSKDTAGCLAQAVEINPHSLKSWILMGEEYARQGDIMKSIKCFESAAKIFPEYEIPYLRTAVLLQKLGHKEESIFLFDKCKAMILPLQGP